MTCKSMNPHRSRGGKSSTGKIPSRDQITITLPRNHDLVSEFINQPPETSTSVTVKKLHRGLTYADAVVIWKGRVVSCESKGEEVDFECESVYSMMRRYGLAIPLRADLPAPVVWR